MSNPAPNELPLTIATLRKNARESILIRLCQYEGRTFIDARVIDIASGSEPSFTKKGIGFHPRLTAELVDALLTAQQRARQLGLLDEERSR